MNLGHQPYDFKNFISKLGKTRHIVTILHKSNMLIVNFIVVSNNKIEIKTLILNFLQPSNLELNILIKDKVKLNWAQKI